MKLVMVVFEVVLVYLSLAVCVLGRPQPSEVLHDMDSQQEESAIVPFRRFLKGKGGRSSGGARVGGTGSGQLSTKEIIIIVCSIVGVFLLIIAIKIWHVRKLKKNPNWRFVDCFKRKKPDAQKASATDEKRFVLVNKSANAEKSATDKKSATDEKRFVLIG